ncbi:hypothetical protein DAEQUDRAFT_723776 [Daedalea quercina L-15889]|uniref:F-box domain-containing protein n=1 Tax=Daedalea quercina L-15889 TaxID=1314783 RepID=A0A165S9K0_9APHY|nr:hypothetical protein DAEQUDRAFT_723776 [Daedalea quercina L-15889]
MAPHRAILVHDILLEIFDHLILSSPTDSEDQRDRPALLNAAVACRRFLDPAMTVLWRKLDDFIPLLALFSSFQAVPLPDFERRSSYSYHATAYMFRGDIHDFEWRRFRSYADRVRAITNAGRVNISQSVFRVPREHTPRACDVQPL